MSEPWKGTPFDQWRPVRTEIALDYARWGLAVYAPAKGSKLPDAGTSGVPGRTSATATMDEDIIRRIYEENPDNNVAIRLDMCQTPLCVIDTDTFAAHGKPTDEDKRDGEDVLLEWCEEHGVTLPPTETVITASGGKHRIYRYPEGCEQLKSEDHVLTRVDLLGKGHGEIMPPSLINGRSGIYDWVSTDEGEVPSTFAPAVLPIEIYRLWQASKATVDAETKTDTSAASDDGEDETAGRFKLPKVIKVGERDGILYRYGCALRAKGWTFEAIQGRLHYVNQHRCEEPMDEAAVDKKARQACKYEPTTFKHNEFARRLIQRRHVAYVEGCPMVWTSNGYQMGVNALDKAMREERDSITRTQQKETRAYLLDMAPRIEAETVAANDNLIAFSNAVVDVLTFETMDNFPELRIPNTIPHRWNPNADNADVHRALNAWACGNDERMQQLCETVGLAMYRGKTIQEAPWLWGKRANNGKTTFVETLCAAIGKDNHASIDLNLIGKQFQSTTLMGMCANIYDDSDVTHIESDRMAVARSVLSKGKVPYEVKGGETSSFMSYASNIFTSNSKPKFTEYNRGNFRRFVIIPMEGDFGVGSPDRDDSLPKRLLEEDAIETLLFLGVCALNGMLIRKTGMTKTREGARAMQDVKRDSSSVAAFALDELLFDTEDAESIHEVATLDLYTRYKEYCEDNGRKPCAHNKFSSDMCDMYNARTDKRRPMLADGRKGKPRAVFLIDRP